MLMIFTPVIPYCQDVKTIYVSMSTGTDFYSICVGMGIMMIIEAVSTYLERRGWYIELTLSPLQKKVLIITGVIITILAVSLLVPFPHTQKPEKNLVDLRKKDNNQSIPQTYLYPLPVHPAQPSQLPAPSTGYSTHAITSREYDSVHRDGALPSLSPGE